MYDIFIENMAVFAYHGVLKEENENGQQFLIDACAKVNRDFNFISDKIGNTADYGDIFNFIYEYTKKNTFKLIETLGENLCVQILLIFKSVDYIKIKIKKPNAPIKGSFDSVGVTVEKKRSAVYLLLGSNIEDRLLNLKKATSLISKMPATWVLAASEIYQTSPVGYKNQGDFLNCCLKISTLLAPHKLLIQLKSIESALHREKTILNGPRSIDIDILLYNFEIINTTDLRIPHPRTLDRKFALTPLIDIYNDDFSTLLKFKSALNKLSENDDTIQPYDTGDKDII